MKVLVVEAEDTTSKLLGVMLKQLGYKVELAASCAEGLKSYQERGPQDIVLIAMKFFRGSKAGGTALVDAMLKKNPEQHYAFLTASPVLKKPFQLQDVDDFMAAFRRPGGSRFE
jgi:DNA-binding response OmpR family regulator